jgi:hypothetical protein
LRSSPLCSTASSTNGPSSKEAIFSKKEEKVFGVRNLEWNGFICADIFIGGYH